MDEHHSLLKPARPTPNNMGQITQRWRKVETLKRGVKIEQLLVSISFPPQRGSERERKGEAKLTGDNICMCVCA